MFPEIRVQVATHSEVPALRRRNWNRPLVSMEDGLTRAHTAVNRTIPRRHTGRMRSKMSDEKEKKQQPTQAAKADAKADDEL